MNILPPTTVLRQPSVQALVAANMVPLVGVIFFEWSLFSVVFLYWVENVIIGLCNVMRMRRAEGGVAVTLEGFHVGKEYTAQMSTIARWSFILIFCFHYGLFTAIHGSFVIVLFGPFDLPPLAAVLGIAALVGSHGISYVVNYIGNEEYKRTSVAKLFVQPYKRVVVLHLGILGGAVLIQMLGAPQVALAFFVILKTIVDVMAHRYERSTFSIGITLSK